MPKDIEKLLIARNFDIFKELYREYASSGQLNSLYNHFYIACDGREISVTKKVEVSPIYKLGALSRIFN